MQELRNQHFSIGQFLSSGVNNYCVLCRVKAKKRNNNIQQRTLTSFITIPLYLTITLRARVFYEQIVNEAQPSWLSLVENKGE